MHTASYDVARALLSVLLGLTPLAVAAAEPVVLEAIGGLEAGGRARSYGFVTAGIAPSIASGLRLPIRLTVSDLRYSFDAGGVTTAVQSPGVTLLAGLAIDGRRGRLALQGGGELRRELRRAGGSAPAETDLQPGAVAQLEADLALGSRLHAFAVANYAGAARYTYARLAVLWQLGNLAWSGPRSHFAGVEGAGQGNAETSSAQVGASLQITFVRAQLSLGAHAGLEESWSPAAPRSRAPYGALSLYKRF